MKRQLSGCYKYFDKERGIMRYGGIVILLLAGLIFFVPSLPAERVPVIAIDPGHGGNDKGCKLSNKEYEKDVTLMIALELKKELEATNKLKVQLTRTSDVDVPVAQRMKAARGAQANLFISLHLNAGFDKKAAGYEVYFPGFQKSAEKSNGAGDIIKDMTENKHLNDSVSLSQIMMRNLQKVFPREERGLRDAPMSILEDLSMPAVLVEIGFATNAEDNKTIADDRGRRSIVRALGKSIKEFYRIK